MSVLVLIADYAALHDSRQKKLPPQKTTGNISGINNHIILKSLLLTGKLTVKERLCLDVSMVGIRQWRVCWCVIVCDVISNTCVSTIGHTY